MGEYADMAVDYSFHETYIERDPYDDFDDGYGYSLRQGKLGDDCPKCNKGLVVQRINRTTEQEFLGCSQFPKCKWSL